MQLTEINIYPIKSTRRIALQESPVQPRGLPWDRRWMLVDAEGTFVTARKQPRLALVQTALGPDRLQVTAPGMPQLELPLSPADGERIEVGIWRDRTPAVHPSPEADAWFSDYLGQPLRLVQMTDDILRPVDPAYGQPGDQVSFADGFPLLLISEASLADLNRRLQRPVDMRRFRPNLVVRGCEPYAEDRWRRLRIGDVEFAGVKACSRCIFTTIDPDTGVPDPAREPLRTLGQYRRRAEGGVYFGQNLIPRSEGVIRIGDTVQVLETAGD
ncbi:MOSC domain-containing protein [Thiohalobacter sp. IOR34]|uniref:MOSC domain-containing protein n=1 Tax=Thiohalobacter sp. IOR34 TaxID=3057176 RepID=UPI0025B148F2|nr:MOSC domain-containing protein [Thiohalobacter sp. IOR34]WJW76274.1 MOSC domain-containing protein [Thiohalobacter sp. IOR34]